MLALRAKPGTDHGFFWFLLLNSQVDLIGIRLPILRADGFARPSASPDHRGELSRKALVAEDEAAVGRIPDRVQVSLGDLVGEQAPIASATGILGFAKGAVDGMRSEDWVDIAEPVAAIAGPWVIAWSLHHARPDRIELDVALAGEQVTVGLDYGRAETPFKERARATIRPN